MKKALHELESCAREGIVAELDKDNIDLVEGYQAEILADGVY